MRRAIIVAAVASLIAVLACFLASRPPAPQVQAKPLVQPVVSESEAATAELVRLALDRNADYAQRVKALRSLPRNLSAAQRDSLRELVKAADEQPGVWNDALAALERQEDKCGQLGDDLLAVWHDERVGNAIRDYALQHLEAVYDFAQNKSAIEDLLLEVASRPSGEKENFAGTALLSLERLGRRYPHIQAKAAAAARETVASSSGPAAQGDQEKTVTALQVARTSGDASVLPRARELARDPAALARLRMSALGTIGSLGDASDLDLLADLAKDKDSRVRLAAQTQLKALQKKYAK